MIGVVSTSRADWGAVNSILHRLADVGVAFELYVVGEHLEPLHGDQVNSIAWKINERLPAWTPRSSSAGMIDGFTAIFGSRKLDCLLLVGDRFETLAIAAASTPFNIPIAHVSGGDITEGAIDDAMRHAITKLSHLHFVATEESGRRVRQMGEEPWRVVVTGEPSLDCIPKFPERDLSAAPLLVTLHSETLNQGGTQLMVNSLLLALEQQKRGIIFTAPNADPGSDVIRESILEFVALHKKATFVETLGADYFPAMGKAAAMVGNSSSGILEAASFKLPVVNIGDRQRGRQRARNVIDAPADGAAISKAIEQATSQGFHNSLNGLVNPYGDGKASKRIAERLRHLPENLLHKRFCELSAG